MLYLVLAGMLATLPLSGKHRSWLEDEAAYIITTREEEVFLALPSSEARDRFIASFWEARDPTPGTRRNEFQEEHLERLSEAKRLFRGYGPPGHKSERGRLFILLGKPQERRTYDHASSLWPIELWFYQVDHPKLPDFFYLLFYRKAGVSDYRLWDPIGEGPTALMTNQTQNPVSYDRRAVFSTFQRIDGDLYQAVTAPIPGESRRSSQFSYQELLGILEDYPNQSLNPYLAARYQPGQGIVEADYAFRKIEMSSLFAALPSVNGEFLHYSLDLAPEEITYTLYEGIYYTVFDLELQLSSPEGQLVYQIQDRREIEITDRDWEKVRTRPVSFQGRFPIIPGDFHLSVLLRSRNARVFDTFETDVRFPRSVEVSRLVPARSFRVRDRMEDELAFQVRNILAVPNPEAVYPARGLLRTFLVLAPSLEEEALAIQGRILKGGEVVHSLTRELNRPGGGEPTLLSLEIALGDGLTPGEYLLEVELGAGSNEVRELPFEVVADRDVVAPVVNSPEEYPSGEGRWNVERARQHVALEQHQAALSSLETAVERSPNLDTARLQLGVLAMALGDPERALVGIEPGIMHNPFHYDLLALAGYASEQMERLTDAARYYERARKAQKPDEKLLLALASVYERLGEKEKAVAVKKEIRR